MSLGARVKAKRLEMGWSQMDLARRVGVSQQAINNLEGGQTNKSRYIAELARALDTTVDYLLDGDSSVPKQAASVEPTIIHFNDLPKDVPVLGQTVGGDDGNFFFNGQTIDYFRRPPGAANMRDIYGLFVTGTSMWPRFEDGEPIYASPSRLPAIGDYVVIQLRQRDEGSAPDSYIKRLVRRNGSKIIVEQFNPAKTIEYERDDIVSMHRVVPLIELIGI
ncbi:XRE family transcriptional regulator [Pararhizobium gei]|uniref:XRE family transcriptional regulator n=1 Tax=Pararhizobium gei TaxID=1395951 RepID=UPI0023DC431E|nr:helix-turn-helix domain-containing protein [Rhizobium gei]